MNIAPRKKAFEFSLHGWSRPRLLPLRFQRPPDWLIATAVAGAVVTVFVVREAKESTLQSGLLSRIARQLTYRVEPGPGDAILFPSEGPFDISRGYAAIPRITERLSGSGYRVIAQARMSERMQSLARHGVPPVYDEKTQAGLTILDRQGKRLYEVSSPRRAYSDFDSIPPLVVKSLLFVENRELLEKDRPRLNPGVEWDRLVRAAFEFALNRVGLDREQPGGSTLATQIEKYRHSPEGRTEGPGDKLRQMAAASLRAYRNGRVTLDARRSIVVDYVNSVPLSAYPGYGEVSGLAEGLWIWFGVDPREVDLALRAPPLPAIEEVSADPVAASGGPRSEAREASEAPPEAGRIGSRPGEFAAPAGGPAMSPAEAYKMILSLIVAQRRPSAYLQPSGREQLERETDQYLSLLAHDQVIPAGLAAQARASRLRFRDEPVAIPRPPFVRRKAINEVRTDLLRLLGVDDLYTLDRFDLIARSTIDQHLQQRVTRLLQRLRDPAYVDSAGLRAERLLDRGDPSAVVYSFTLFERTPEGNLLRVQADNVDEPFDVNQGSKLDLGSTAKLRTLTHYLQIMAELHHEMAGRPAGGLRLESGETADPLRRWAAGWLASSPDTTLPAMLHAALERRYSASPGESFFTGGGLHTFHNFTKDENGRIMTVSEAFRNSVNLVFIRLMRDIVRHEMAQLPAYASGILEDPSDPARQEYLARFADKEGKTYLGQFWKKYHGERRRGDPLEILVQGIVPTPKRLAVLYRSIYPDGDLESFGRFLRAHLPGAGSDPQDVADLYDNFAPDQFTLDERGYLAKIHPLELWLVRYMKEHPDASWKDVVAASESTRQDVYAWLFKSTRTKAQNIRIWTLLEAEAFERIHEAWQRLGYPFDRLVPSLATAIGSSADRPAALAELIGILGNDGVRLPSRSVTGLDFAVSTPYETRFAAGEAQGERVLPPAVAEAVREELFHVVMDGTARRAFNDYRVEGEKLPLLGGKTGTGDHRYETFGPGRRLLESRVVNRTATFVFLLGDRYFGTITAVPGERAARYDFSSALPVQIMRILASDLRPLVDAGVPPRRPEPAPGRPAEGEEEDDWSVPAFSPSPAAGAAPAPAILAVGD